MGSSPIDVALSVSKLNKSYGNFKVIRDLELQVARGSIHGLVGLNGSGKTTTLECILGLKDFNSGNISVLGHSPADLHRARGKIVAIFDTPSLPPNVSLRHCLQHASLLCEKAVRSPEQVEAMLGLESFSNFKIKQLSLGNKRRASIAHALLGQAELILLDEPFNGLDAGGVDDVLSLITRLNAEEGTSFLLSSHQLPYLEQVCSHIAVLNRGAIAVSDSVTNLLKENFESVLIRSEDRSSLLTALQSIDAVEYLKTDDEGYHHVSLANKSSAELNQELNAKNIEVSELILQRASLASMFRKITSEDSE